MCEKRWVSNVSHQPTPSHCQDHLSIRLLQKAHLQRIVSCLADCLHRRLCKERWISIVLHQPIPSHGSDHLSSSAQSHRIPRAEVDCSDCTHSWQPAANGRDNKKQQNLQPLPQNRHIYMSTQSVACVRNVWGKRACW